MDWKNTKVSIIVPVYNSENILPKLLERINKIACEQKWNLQLLLIDDGSRDQSFQVISALATKYSFITGIRLSRNFGHQNAVSVGLKECTGDVVAIIDDDLQDPPELLPKMFEKLNDGFEVVYGIRKKRKEPPLKIFLYKIFYRVLKRVSMTDIPLDTGDFCVMKSIVVKHMIQMQEKNPFLRGLRSWIGFSQTGFEYERDSRDSGSTNYSLAKLTKLALDGIFSFSVLPLRMVSYLGALGICIAFSYSIYLMIKVAFFSIEVQGFTSIILSILFFGSLNLIGLGVLGEYVARIYDESKNRPLAIIAEKVHGLACE